MLYYIIDIHSYFFFYVATAAASRAYIYIFCFLIDRGLSLDFNIKLLNLYYIVFQLLFGCTKQHTNKQTNNQATCNTCPQLKLSSDSLNLCCVRSSVLRLYGKYPTPFGNPKHIYKQSTGLLFTLPLHYCGI